MGTIRVTDMGFFFELAQMFGNDKIPEGVAEGYTTQLLTPDLKTFKDERFPALSFFYESVQSQSEVLQKFGVEIRASYPATAWTISYAGQNYHKAEVDSSDRLTLKKADGTNVEWFDTDNLGLDKHDAHGWRKEGADAQDKYETELPPGSQPKAPQGAADWTKGGNGPGQILDYINVVFQAIDPSLTQNRSTRWLKIAGGLDDARDAFKEMKNKSDNTWSGPASKLFSTRMGESVTSVGQWASAAKTRGKHLATYSEYLETTKAAIKKLKDARDKAIPEYSPGTGQPGPVGPSPQPSPTPSPSAGPAPMPPVVIELLKAYDGIGMLYAKLTSDVLTTGANWTSPNRYPGFTDMLPGTAVAPTGSLPPGGPPGGGPKVPGGGPKPPNTQKQLDDIVKRYEDAIKKQKAAYEKAIKELQEQMDKMKKEYEKLLKEQAAAAQKQIDALQNAMKEQQQQAQQDAQKAMDQAQQQIDDLNRTSQEKVDALGMQLNEALTASGASAALLGSLPAYLSGLSGGSLPGSPGLAGLGGLAGLAGVGGLGGTNGLSTATGSLDLMGRGGSLPGTTTGLGTTALSGRGPAPGGLGGGMPFLPPMGGQQAGATSGSLAGRKGRPSIPDPDKNKPTTRPRIVDPAGDGSADAKPVVREGDRRAKVAQPVKAPDAEQGQALGRTA